MVLSLFTVMTGTARAERVCPYGHSVYWEDGLNMWWCDWCCCEYPDWETQDRPDKLCPYGHHVSWDSDCEWWWCDECSEVYYDDQVHDAEPEPSQVDDFSRIGNEYRIGDTLPGGVYYYDFQGNSVYKLNEEKTIQLMSGVSIGIREFAFFDDDGGDASYLYFRPWNSTRYHDSVSVVKIYEGSGTHDNSYKIKPQYSVSFNANGGSPNPPAQQVWRGEKVTRPDDPSSASGVFDGWYNGSTLWNFDQDTVDYPITLTAHWGISVSGVTLNKYSATLPVGSTETLTASVDPSDATHKNVIWASDNEGVATVADGVVTAVSVGTANITVTATNGTADTADDKTATCAVTVETAYTRVPYQAATSTEEGNIEYYTGSDGRFYVKDGDTYIEIAENSWVIPVFGPVTFTLPKKIKTVEESAFEGLPMTIVEIPTGCTSIGKWAFRNCTGLTQIRIPASVTSIDTTAFDGCVNVLVYGEAGSAAETFCGTHANCTFIPEDAGV